LIIGQGNSSIKEDASSNSESDARLTGLLLVGSARKGKWKIRATQKKEMESEGVNRIGITARHLIFI
jgi:hypothetical protein